ncbi:MAG TPA: hypothetical protein VGN17_17865 [Bryobacteraceae bacterium]|jgi:hypothetical protein
MRASLVGRLLIPLVLAAACAALLLQKTDLSIVDLGRHLKNGDVLLHGTWAEKQAVLHTNFYSYAQGEFPFVNHHWLSGVVFYLAWRAVHFEGLTILYFALVAASLIVMYLAVRRAYGTAFAAPLAALAIPLLAWRYDVRPEGFTYLLTAVFYSVLLAWRQGLLSDKWLYVLPALMLLWVNLHIGFVFGFLLIGFFGLKSANYGRKLWPAAGLSVLAALLNPNLLAGLLYPLNIFRNYGYSVAENQSIAGLAGRGMAGAWEYTFFYWMLAVAAGSFVLRWFVKKPGSESRIPEGLLLGAVAFLAFNAVRNLPLFALLMIPVVAGNLHDVLSAGKTLLNSTYMRIGSAVVFGIGLLYAGQQYEEKQRNFGIGLRDGVEATMDFLHTNRVGGPWFNDIDNGGYLIFHSQGVFVDGRPEAYPSGFLEKSYIGALSDDAAWRELDAQHHFNAIVCSLEDGFPPIERFLIARAHDSDWAPVYTDSYSLVFVRRTDANADVIRAHEIPQSQFR